jgi:hypothetical protein
LTAKELTAIETQHIGPLTQHLHGLAMIDEQYDAERDNLAKETKPDGVRAIVRKALTDSPLASNTKFSKKVAGSWSGWEKLTSADAMKKVQDLQRER